MTPLFLSHQMRSATWASLRVPAIFVVAVLTLGFSPRLAAQTREAHEGGVVEATQVNSQQAAHYRYKSDLQVASRQVALPDLTVTPGAIRTTDKNEICDSRFRTKKYRKATTAVKKQVCYEYGVEDCPKRNAMELDDVVPLELGGENVKSNLWVQMAPEYHLKDAAENWAKIEVCLGKLDLAYAQKQMVEDWTVLYDQMKASEK